MIGRAMDDDAKRAIGALTSVLEEAQAMVKAGAVGTVLDETMLHAQELLDVIDCELLQLEPASHVDVFETAAKLRWKLAQLRDDLRQNAF